MDNDSDVIKEIIEPAEKSCHCPSSNKNSEQTNDKTREDLIQKIELDPEPEDIEQTMEEYLEKESDSQEDQPLDCTLDFIKLPQPERDWRDYKPGIETTSTTGNQVTESIDKQMEHQTDTVTQGYFFNH